MTSILDNSLTRDVSINALEVFTPISRLLLTSKDRIQRGGAAEEDNGSPNEPDFKEALKWQKVIVAGRLAHIIGAVSGNVFSTYDAWHSSKGKSLEGGFLGNVLVPIGGEEGSKVNIASNYITPVLSGGGLITVMIGLYKKLLALKPNSEARRLNLAGTVLITIAGAIIMSGGMTKPSTYFNKMNQIALGSTFTLGTLMFILGTAFQWGEVTTDADNYEQLRKTYARIFSVLCLILFISVWILAYGISRATSKEEDVQGSLLPPVTGYLVTIIFGIAFHFELKDYYHYKHIVDGTDGEE